tara:strand:- start:232 stop:546 length:315 start_codon:yes stop_codon:yes gene_type:complete
MYIGWDIGIKNLSYCILDSKGDIIEWDIIDLTGMDECKFKCISCKKNGEVCSKTASYIDKNDTMKFYCKTHSKQNQNTLLELYTCFKCNKVAKKEMLLRMNFFV